MEGLLRHLSLLGTWGAATLVLVGIGALLDAPRRTGHATWRDLFTRFWVGLGGAILVLQAWHMAWPVDGRVVYLLAGIGLAGLWRVRRHAPSVVAGIDARAALVALLLVLWTANRALGPTTLFDTGMYHQPVVAWTNAHAIVPGLANLHGRLGFNSASLLFASVFDLGAFDGASLHLANGLLYAVLLVDGVCAWCASRRVLHPRVYDLFSIAILPNVVHGLLRQDVRSLSTDAATGAVLFASMRLLFDHLAHLPPAGIERARRVATILFVFTTAVTIKLSGAVLAATGALLASWTLRERASQPRIAVWRLALGISPAVVLIALWLVRGVVLTGYPLYPADLLPFPVDWRVSAEQLAAEAAWIEMSARNLNSNVILPGLSWIGPWARGVVIRGDLFAQLTVPVLLCVIVAGVAWVRRDRLTRLPWSPGWQRVAIPLGLSLAFWLITAPHSRMAQGMLWSAAAIVLAWWSCAAASGYAGLPRARLGAVVGGIILFLVLKQVAGAAARAETRAMVAALAALVTLPDDGRWMAPVPAPQLVPDTIGGALVVHVPSENNACWNTSLLCTPHPSSTLRLRRPDLPYDASIRYGFRSEGARWHPRRWPNPWSPFLTWWRCTRTSTLLDAGARCLERVASPPGDSLSEARGPVRLAAPGATEPPPPM